MEIEMQMEMGLITAIVLNAELQMVMKMETMMLMTMEVMMVVVVR